MLVKHEWASSILVWGAKENEMHLLRDMVRDPKFWAGLFIVVVFGAQAALVVIKW